MTRFARLLLAATSSVVVFAATAAAAEDAKIQVTPVTRSPFPERGYVVDLQAKAQVAHDQVHVSENGRPIRSFTFLPTVDASAAQFGVVLLIDASESMRGKPYAAALAAAHAFVAQAQPNEKIGVVAFNRIPRVVAKPTTDASAVLRALRNPPALAHGTQIYDGVAEALTLLRRADVLSGSIVLLSDGADTGSTAAEESVAAQARHAHVRVFGVGLRSGAFDGGQLEALAFDTGAAYAEASSAAALARVYRDLGVRLASEYLLEYRSGVSPDTHLDVRMTIDGVGEAATAYVAPKLAGQGPFHKSILDRFWA
jgi:tight adherence protein B